MFVESVVRELFINESKKEGKERGCVSFVQTKDSRMQGPGIIHNYGYVIVRIIESSKAA